MTLLRDLRRSSISSAIGELCQIIGTTRDLGYGSEQIDECGIFNGDCDTWGKWTFTTDDGRTLYLFEDEVSEIHF